LTSGIIFDIKRFAIHDGPGIRTTVFLKGCPLSCRWCHNPEGQSAKPGILYRREPCLICGTCVEACEHGARSASGEGVARDPVFCVLCRTCVEVCPSGALEKVGRRTSVEQLMREIEGDTPFFDESGGGVTFSGGEPLMQPRFLEELLARCRERDIHTAVDTCGLAEPQVLRSVAEKTDLVLFDLKVMDIERHVALTGVRNDLILSNLQSLTRTGVAVQIRIPVIPSVTDTADNLAEIGGFVSSLKGPPAITLLPHHPLAMEKYARFDVPNHLAADTGEPTGEELAEIAAKLTEYGLDVSYPEGVSAQESRS
jgi:pyruvate formate lyase activating enzyme